MDRRDCIKKATMAAAGAAVVSPVSAMINGVTGVKTPKVLLINGSPRTDGNTFCCLKEIEVTLQKHGVESEIGSTPKACRPCGRWPRTWLSFCRRYMPTAIQLPSVTKGRHS